MAERTLLHQEAEDQLRPSECGKKTHVELGYWVTWTSIIALTKIGVSIRIPPECGDTRVASQLGHRFTTGGELKKVARCRRIFQVTVLIRKAMVGIWDPHDMVE